ncbi:unnamed protein product, partial [Scytosiphon promiscuus]
MNYDCIGYQPSCDGSRASEPLPSHKRPATKCLAAQAKFAEAETLYGRSLALREKVLGPEHPDVAISLNNSAALLIAQVESS